MNINAKTFIVTGAGNGMGRELSLQLLQKGASAVNAVDRDLSGLAELKSLAGSDPRLSTHQVDLSDSDNITAFTNQLRESHIIIDGVINNAGIIQPFKRFHELDEEVMRKVMDVNFWGTVRMTKAILPLLLMRPEAHIVNVSSMGGFLPVPGQTIYGASKAAVKLFTEGLYAELADTNVKVNCVFPGATATNITQNSGVSIERKGGEQKESTRKITSAADAARQIIEAIEQGKLHAHIGNDSKLMDLLYKWFPKGTINLITSQMKSLLSN